MTRSIEKVLLKSISLLMRPIIRLALRNGVTFRQFSDLSKGLYVDVASTEYGVSGRDTNVSRVSLITGINRKDIKRLKDAALNGDDLVDSHSPDRVSRILSAWHMDKAFLDADGSPAELPLEGVGSFSELIKKHGGDIASITLLREFKRSGVVEETLEKRVKVLKRYFIPNPVANPDQLPSRSSEDAVAHAGSILNDHMTTIFHNLYRENEVLPPRFERRATNHRVEKVMVEKFRGYVAEEGQAFLERVDNWMSLHQAEESIPDSKCVRLGMGTYWIEDSEKTNEIIVPTNTSA